MRNKNLNLKGQLAALLAVTLISGLNSTDVFATDSSVVDALHVGVASVLNSQVNNDDVELTAGAAVFLEGDNVELADNGEVEIPAQVSTDEVAEPATETEEAVEPEEVSENTVSTVVMANVKDAVNVRADANEESDTVGKLFKNCGGEIMEQKDGWTLLQSGDLKGWTKDEFLLFGDDAEAFRNEVGTLKATVKTDALRIRKEANEDAGVLDVAKSGDTLTALEELGDWVSVQYNDKTVGYVSSQYVDVAFTVDAGKTNEQIKKEEAEAEKKKLSKNRGAVDVAVSDTSLLAALIQCEAGNESYEGKLAVGAVVMNRVRSGSYGGSVSSVINAAGQFPPATNGKVAAVLAKGPSKSCLEAAQAAISGASNVGGATHFRAAGSTPGVVIGNHVFW